MGCGPVIFNYELWSMQFPEFSGVSEAAVGMYFNIATMYVRNDGQGSINDINMLTSMLNLTTAHLTKIFSAQAASLNGGTVGAAPNPLVGRIDSGSQGSVSVSVEMPDQQPNAAWWNQTIYGAACWAAMKPYRTMRYIGPTRRRIYNPPVFVQGGWRGWGGLGGWRGGWNGGDGI